MMTILRSKWYVFLDKINLKIHKNEFKNMETIAIHKKYKYFIYDQKGQPCCVVSSFVSLNEYLYQMENTEALKFSVLFTYYNSKESERQIFHTDNNEISKGLHVRSIIDSIINHGLIYQEKFSSILPENKFNIPDGKIIDESLKHINGFSVIHVEKNISDLKRYLSQYKPVIGLFKFNIGRNDIDLSKKVLEPSKDDSIYHSVLITGYNDDYFIFQNSYGEQWGIEGFGKLSYSYIENSYGLYTISNCVFK